MGSGKSLTDNDSRELSLAGRGLLGQDYGMSNNGVKTDVQSDRGGIKNDFHIFIDCTDTTIIGSNPGIQRVVRNIVCRAEATGKRLGCSCIPVVMFNGDFWPAAIIPSSRSYKKTVSGLYEIGKRFYRKFEPGIKVKKSSPDELPRKNSAYGKKTGSIKSLLKKYSRGLFFLPLWIMPLFKQESKIHFAKDDILLLPDAFWADSDFCKVLQKSKEAGTLIIPVIHDLIPLTHSQFNNEEYNERFKKNFHELICVADGAITLSQKGKSELGDFVSCNFSKSISHFPIEYFYHGADFKEESGGSISLRSKILPLISGRKPYLAVGTIEPRKGYETILDAFNHLWGNGINTPLCIVGKIGGGVDHIMEKINESRYLNKNLFVFHDINDSELVALYKNSKSLIFASAAEGFGLPLVESMHYKLPVIASDIPIFKEIGRDYPVYFPQGDVEALIKIVSNFEILGVSGHPSVEWMSWDESIQMLFEKVLVIKSAKESLTAEANCRE